MEMVQSTSWIPASCSVRALRYKVSLGKPALLHCLAFIARLLASSTTIHYIRSAMNTTVTEPPEVIQHVGIAIRSNVIQALVATLFYGFFCILICYLSYLLLRKGLKSRANLILFTVTLIMFALCTCYWGLGLAVTIKQIQDVLILNPDHTLESEFSTANDFANLLGVGSQLLGMIIYFFVNRLPSNDPRDDAATMRRCTEPSYLLMHMLFANRQRGRLCKRQNIKGYRRGISTSISMPCET
ncbi:hypothetical protein EW146_g1967 [Bondarzewia mesenterica]|uniref:Uncharacterized protein n=1 Tax=Bondarzewia mesenterica TaxID=1095465 RepID=A0A4S4M282_9AGAM|nr:hypothetical protein EW146_g1967 [Bondarzewia mesenterica]